MTNGSSSRRHGTQNNHRYKSKKKASHSKNRANRTQQMRLHSDEFGQSDMVPPIQDPGNKVFTSPKHTVLAKSRKAKTKANHSVMGNRFPSRRIYYKKGAFTRGKLSTI